VNGQRLCLPRYRFVGPFHSESVCRVDFFDIDTGHPIVVFTELRGNPGTCVANVFASLATEIYMAYLFPLDTHPRNVTWLEHNERKCGFRETWDEVSLKYDEASGRFGEPKWTRSTKPVFWVEATG